MISTAGKALMPGITSTEPTVLADYFSCLIPTPRKGSSIQAFRPIQQVFMRSTEVSTMPVCRRTAVIMQMKYYESTVHYYQIKCQGGPLGCIAAIRKQTGDSHSNSGKQVERANFQAQERTKMNCLEPAKLLVKMNRLNESFTKSTDLKFSASGGYQNCV